MAESHVISALVKKRRELAGEIEYYKKLLDKSLAFADSRKCCAILESFVF